jgi:hypothetical protein
VAQRRHTSGKCCRPTRQAMPTTLYAALRDLDHADTELIVVEAHFR